MKTFEDAENSMEEVYKCIDDELWYLIRENFLTEISQKYNYRCSNGLV